MKMLFLVVVMTLFAWGCHDGCEPETTRCHGEEVQVCNTEEDWEKSIDCNELSEGTPLKFECRLDPEDGIHSCLLAGGGLDAGLDTEFGTESDAGDDGG